MRKDIRTLASLVVVVAAGACSSGSTDGHGSAPYILDALQARLPVATPAVGAPSTLAHLPGAPPGAIAPERALTPAKLGTRSYVHRPEGFVAATSVSSARVARPGGRESISAAVRSPARAAGSFHVEDPNSKMAVDVSLVGAKDVAGQIQDGHIVYPNAFATGHWIHDASDGGMQDFLSFDGDPGRAAVAYSVSLTKVTSLRLVANSLEFLDPKGAPRLRIPSPFIVGSDHKTHAAKLSVRDCAVDMNPATPWGRTLPTPGRAQCTIDVAWDGSAVQYPAVLDPSWTTTASMSVARYRHAATLLGNGRVLVAGGFSETAELYDPTTGTWSVTGSMAGPRHDPELTTLPDGRAMVTGGGDNAGERLTLTEIYDPATGAWSPSGNLSVSRSWHQATVLHDGRVLVSGGYHLGANFNEFIKSAEIWDNGTWTQIADMNTIHVTHTATLLDDGRVLVAGGNMAQDGVWTAVEIFDPATGQWTPEPLYTHYLQRTFHSAFKLSDGRVMFAGGINDMYGEPLSSVEIFDPVSMTWSSANPLPIARGFAKGVAVNSQFVLAGGSVEPWTPLTPLDNVDIYDGTGTWTPAESLNEQRLFHTATALPGGILVTGGLSSNSQVLATAEVAAELPAPPGPPIPLVPSDIGHNHMATPSERFFVRAFVDYDGTSNAPQNQFPTADPAAFDRMYFGGDGGLNVNDFYKTVSHGSFEWKSAGFIGAADPTNPALIRPIIAHVNANTDEEGRFHMLEFVLAQAVAQGFNFEFYDKEPFGEIWPEELAFVIISNGNTDPVDGFAKLGAGRGIWNGMTGSASSNCVEAVGAFSHGVPVRICANEGAGSYVLDFGKDASMQVVTHEMAHMLGAIDMYPETSKGNGNTNATTMGEVDADTVSAGVQHPGHSDRTFSVWLEAWHRMQFGWDLPTVVDATTLHNETFTFSNPGDILALHYGPERFFLLESRKQTTPYDGNVHEDGVAVWYVEQDANHNPKITPAIEGMQSGMLYDTSFIRSGERFELNWPGSSNYTLSVAVATNASGRFVVNYKSSAMLAYRGAIQGYGSKCMDAGEWFAPSDARLNDCRGTRSQSWIYSPLSKLIQDANGERCLEMPDTLGWRLLVNTCNPTSPLQQWTWDQTNGTLSAGGKCAFVANGWVNGLVTAADCAGDIYDLWHLAPNVLERNPPRVSIQSTTSGCLQPIAQQTNVDVQTFPCTGDPLQQWQIFGTGEIKNIGQNTLCLEALGGAGAAVVVRECQRLWETKRPGLLWDVEPTGRIRNSNGLLLTSLDSVPPRKVSIDDELNSPFQIWTITPVPPPPP